MQDGEVKRIWEGLAPYGRFGKAVLQVSGRVGRSKREEVLGEWDCGTDLEEVRLRVSRTEAHLEGPSRQEQVVRGWGNRWGGCGVES